MGLDAQLVGRGLEDRAMRLGVSDLVGEGEAGEEIREALRGQEAAQGPGRRDQGVGDHAEPIAQGQAAQRIGDALYGVGRDRDLHLLVRLDDLGEGLGRQLAAQGVQDPAQPLADGPGDEVLLPGPVEGGIGVVVGRGHRLRGDGRQVVERLPDQTAALRRLGTQALGRALGFVGAVPDQGVPEIEAHRLQHRVPRVVPAEPRERHSRGQAGGAGAALSRHARPDPVARPGAIE